MALPAEPKYFIITWWSGVGGSNIIQGALEPALGIIFNLENFLRLESACVRSDEFFMARLKGHVDLVHYLETGRRKREHSDVARESSIFFQLLVKINFPKSDLHSL